MEISAFDATLTAAFIGGAASLVVTVLAKDQKTSEFRQAWIDELRKDVATLAAQVPVLLEVAKTRSEAGGNIKDFLIENQAVFIEAEATINRIKLRLNAEEDTEALSLLAVLESKDGKATPEQARAAVDQLVMVIQKILKTEWTRVKRGEPSFRMLKFSGALLAGLGLVSVILHFKASWHPLVSALWSAVRAC